MKFEPVTKEPEDIHYLPKLAYQDYMKDLQTCKRFNLTYTEYMECIFNELITSSDCKHNNVCDSDLTGHTYEPCEHTSEPHSYYHSSPVAPGRIHEDIFKDAYIPSKRLGFLSHQAEKF